MSILSAKLQLFPQFPIARLCNRIKKAICSMVKCGDASEMLVICNPGLPQASRGPCRRLTVYLEEVVTKAALVTWSPIKLLCISIVSST
jgi:hypothetical protein